MSTDKEPKELSIKEESDGSAVVELPDDLSVDDQDSDVNLKETNNDHDDGGEAHADGGHGHDDDQDQPDDTEAIRAARRARRKAKKEYIKQSNAEKDARLVNLQRQNQELMERLLVVEKRTHSTELARIDKAIEDQELRLQYAKLKMKEATDNSDGNAFTQAQEMWFETRNQLEAIKGLKQRAAQAAVNERPNIDDNRELQRHAGNWMERNPWYDPNGSDEDSEIAKIIDARLVKEGWNPNSADYWDELDNRLSKRVPHRYTQGQETRPSRRPRSVVTGSGRESMSSSGSKNTVVLAPEQVRAMKDAGFWDDPEKRQKMIRRYAEAARNSTRN